MKRKKTLTGVIIAGLVIAALFGLSAAANLYIEKQLPRWVSDALTEGTEISFEEPEVSVFRGEIRVGEFALIRKSGEDTLWSVTASEIKIQVSSLFFLAKSGSQLKIELMELTMPEIDVFRENPDFNVFQSDQTNAKKNAERKEVIISGLKIYSGHLRYLEDRRGSVSVRFTAEAENTSLREGSLRAERYNVRLTDLAYTDSEGVYRTEVRSAIFRDRSPEVELIGIESAPVIDMRDFKRRFPFRKSLISGETGRISIFGLRGNLTDSLILGTVKIDRPVWRIVRDNSLPLPDRERPMPQQALAELSIDLRADSVLLLRGTLDIDISANHRKLPARLSFRQMNAEITQVQNTDPNLPAFTARAFGIFEEGTETALFAEYRYGEDHPWKLNFTAGELNLVRLNPLLEAATRIEIQSGLMKSLDLTLNGNKNKTLGRIDLMYENLTFDIATKEDRKPSKIGHILSETLGKIFYHQSNPEGGKLETVEFESERDMRKGFSGQWTDALSEGAIQTVMRIDEERAAAFGEKIKKFFSGSEE